MLELRTFPMLAPFAEAVAFQLERKPMTSAEFAALELEQRMRAFTIGGGAKHAVVTQAYELATRAIAEGLTRDEFLDQLGTILDGQEGLLLSPRRLELIAQNNLAVSYASGRWNQLTDPDVLARRPYLQYPLGPNDSRTSDVCRRLQGFVARHDDPAWQHIYPPNHHHERHLQVTTLTEEQARATGRLQETDGFPVAPDGGRVLPDEGWDFDPSKVTNVDDVDLARRAAGAGAMLPTRSARSHDLVSLDQIERSALPAAPAIRFDPITDIYDEDQYARARGDFAKAFGIGQGESGVWHPDYSGQRLIRINDSTFEHLIGLDTGLENDLIRKRDRPRFFDWILPTIQDPFEAWMTVRESAAGTPELWIRYIGLYDWHESPSGFLVFADMSAQGWFARSGFVRDPSRLESYRRGYLLRSKAPRQGVSSRGPGTREASGDVRIRRGHPSPEVQSIVTDRLNREISPSERAAVAGQGKGRVGLRTQKLASPSLVSGRMARHATEGDRA